MRVITQGIANLRYALHLLWSTSRTYTIAVGVIAAIAGALTPLQLWIVALLVDEIAQSQNGALLSPTIFTIVTSLVLLYLLQNVIEQVNQVMFQRFGSLISEKINYDILNKANQLELSLFETPSFYDSLRRAQEEASSRPISILLQMILFVQGMLAIVSLLFVLLRFNPLLILGLFLGALAALQSQSYLAALEFNTLNFQIPSVRKLLYLGLLLTNDAFAKEIRIFGLGEHFLNEYLVLLKQQNLEKNAVATRRAARGLLVGSIGALIFGGALTLVAGAALQGSVTLGDVTLYIGAFIQSQAQIALVIGSLTSIYQSGLFLSNLQKFLALESRMQPPKQAKPVPRYIEDGIQMHGIWFTYPGEETPVLKNINLSFRPGEIVALVGENGAGKTTLVKLLTRLYDPSCGRITLDGTDLKEFNPNELRQLFGVIFQDYIQYQATVRENIGYGDLVRSKDNNLIREVATKTGADRFIQKLPHKYDTLLGKWFEEGHQISTGQWQLIALARALLRESSVVILDEPTASLDPATESAVFNTLKEHLSKGQIGLIVSHRFSTVRLADRIVVLESGEIKEMGSHAELITQGGIYANLYQLQAETYRGGSDVWK